MRILVTILLSLMTTAQAAIRTLDSRAHHLGLKDRPEWDIFAGNPPERDSLKLEFESHPNSHEFTLFIRQDDVKQEWSVVLNGVKLGELFLMEERLTQTLSVPPNTLREGSNELAITTKTIEDIVIEKIELGDDLKEKLLTAGPFTVEVHDRATGKPLPSRITIVDSNGALVPLFDFSNTNLATRPGVVYTATGTARLKTLPGQYTVYATRGPEYTMAIARDVDFEHSPALDLTIERAADTPGWIASDTHIHTFSLSKHGDALLRERIITLAAEAIELPVSTEHNVHADYQPTIDELGLGKYFTLLRGNEVTTAKGHFNIFPVELNAKPPDAKEENWPKLLKEIRATPKVKVAILNHPTDTHSGFTPFARTNFNPITGRNLRGDFEFTFDGMELINSGAMRSDWMEPIRDWFGLLNRGYKLVGVGASDSHDVSRFIVGQGRTYIRADDSDVSKIDLDKACESLKAGHALVSLGVIAQLSMQDSAGKIAGPGELLSPNGESLQLNIRADFPLAPHSSVTMRLFANGVESSSPVARSRRISTNVGVETLAISLHKPAHDTFYVTIVTVDGNPEPSWGLARPYQPTSPHIDLQMIGVTNPIWIDADGDGKFTSAREYAVQLTEKYQSLPELIAQLATYDYYVAAHCAELLSQQGENVRSQKIADELAKAAPQTQRAFREYGATLAQ